MEYRSKPRVIEAEQFFKDKPLPFPEKSAVGFDGENFYVETIHDNQKVILEDGDFVIPEPNGINFYPCKPDIFTKNWAKFEDKIMDLTDFENVKKAIDLVTKLLGAAATLGEASDWIETERLAQELKDDKTPGDDEPGETVAKPE